MIKRKPKEEMTSWWFNKQVINTDKDQYRLPFHHAKTFEGTEIQDTRVNANGGMEIFSTV